MGNPEGDEKEKGAEKISEEIITEGSINLLKVININIHEAQHIPSKKNAKRALAIHILIKLSKIKDKQNLKLVAREKLLLTYKGFSIK